MVELLKENYFFGIDESNNTFSQNSPQVVVAALSNKLEDITQGKTRIKKDSSYTSVEDLQPRVLDYRFFLLSQDNYKIL